MICSGWRSRRNPGKLASGRRNSMTERLETATTSGTAIQWSLAKGPCADGHAEEKTFIAELRVGNEQAFEVLLDRLSGPMLRFARSILSDRETAEEVVQDTWLAAIRGLDRFEGRLFRSISEIERVLSTSSRQKPKDSQRIDTLGCLRLADRSKRRKIIFCRPKRLRESMRRFSRCPRGKLRSLRSAISRAGPRKRSVRRLD